MVNSEQTKHLLVSKVNSGINALEFQKTRILKKEFMPLGVPPTHDADFYMVILRRLFRIVEKTAKTDSSVANLKGKYQHLYSKIKVRDHFEHGVDCSEIPDEVPGIKFICCLVNSEQNPYVLSGNQKWFLKEDHKAILDLMNQFLQIFQTQ